MSRNSNIELLRIILMIMVVVLHICVYKENLLNYPPPQKNANNYNFILIFVRNLCVCAVNTFMFISGFYGIKFKMVSAYKMYMQALFYGLLSVSLLILFHKATFVQYAGSFFPITRGAWWFLSSYMVVYMFSPLINKGIAYLSKRKYSIILVSFLIFLCFSMTFGSQGRFGASFFLLLTIYLLGRYIALYKITIRKPAILFLICYFILAVVTFLSFKYNLWSIYRSAIAYNSILVVLMSVALFFVFYNMKIDSRFINKLAQGSFAVYLLSESTVGKYLIHDRLPYFTHYKILEIVLLAISVYFISWLVEYIRIHLFQKIELRIYDITKCQIKKLAKWVP